MNRVWPDRSCAGAEPAPAKAGVVQVAVGNACQPFEAGLSMHLERPLAQLAGGGAGERAVQRIHLGQQADVFRGVVPPEGNGRRMAPVFDLPAVHELGNAARNRSAG